MPTKKNKRVLLVDDDRQIVETLQLALENRGYEVLVARDGHEGLIRAERDAPDLIVLDVMMPKRSGFSVLERIRYCNNTGPRIIVVTANDEQRHRDFVMSKGADMFLSKPFDIEELLSMVDRLLAQQRPPVTQ